MNMRKSFIRLHLPALLLALTIGAATAVPQLSNIRAMGDAFAGVYPINNDDELYYMTRARDALDGHVFLTNPYLFEHKDGSPMQFWLPDYLEAHATLWFFSDHARGYQFFDFLFPAILALLTYGIAYKLTNSTSLALLTALVLHLGIFFEDFNRAPSPQFTFLFFLLFWYAVVSYLKSPRRYFLAIAALALGAQFNFYPYHWTYTLVALGIFLVAAKFVYRSFALKPYAYMLAGGGILGIPYFFSLVRSMQNPFYKESLMRLGLIHTHTPSGMVIVAAATGTLILWGILFSAKMFQRDILNIFAASIAAAGIIAVNQHVLTGKNLEFSSHYLMAALFGAVLLAAYLAGIVYRSLAAQKKFWGTFFLIAAGTVGIPFSLWRVPQVVAKQSVPTPTEWYVQTYAPLFHWLQTHTPKESVVYADQQLSRYIPAYTHNNVFYTREANLFFLSDSEVKERFVISTFFQKSFNREFVLANERALWGVHYIDERGHERQVQKIKTLLHRSTALPPATPPESEITDVVRLRALVEQEGFLAAAERYRLEYIVWDRNREPTSHLDGESYLTPVADIGSFTVYTFK